jgi:hypothetical protein
MSNPADPGKQPPRDGDPAQIFTQELQYSNVAARVPERVARGVFANGAFVIQGPSEFVIDFVQRMNKPHQIVARVFLPFHLVPPVIGTLRGSLDKHRQSHGPTPVPGHPVPGHPAPGHPASGHPASGHPTPGQPAPAAAAQSAPQPAAVPAAGSPGSQTPHAGPVVNVDEVYQDLKMSEEVMHGVYANALLVVFNAADFCLDFIVNLYPRAVVTARVFMSAAQVAFLLTSLNQAWQNLQAKQQQQQQHPPRPPS